MNDIKNKVLLVLLSIFIVPPLYAGEMPDLKKYNRLSFKADWLNDYYNIYKIMRNDILIYQINNPEITLAGVAEKFSKKTADAKVVKEIKLTVSGESIIATIILKDPEGGTFREDVLSGRCLGTDVDLLLKYCR